MDDANPSFSRNGNGKPVFRHRIHSRRYNGRIEPDVGSELGSNVDFSWKNLGIAWNKQHIVKVSASSRILMLLVLNDSMCKNTDKYLIAKMMPKKHFSKF